MNAFFSLDSNVQNELQDFLSSYEKHLLNTSINDAKLPKKRVKKI